jgi:hypothetical protein
MSTKGNQLSLDAIAEVGNEYYWEPFLMATGISNWYEGTCRLDEVGKSQKNSICCFDFILLLAAKRGYVTKQSVKELYGRIAGWGGAGAQGFGPDSSLWKDWPGFIFSSTYWRPPKGDVVFFESGTGGDLNHVVFSLGPNTNDAIEVVSFGEELEKPTKAAVTRKTIAQLRQEGHTAVKFLKPFWDN